MAANKMSEKTYSAIERMDGCNTSKKVIIAPQKERIIRTNFFCK